MARRAQRRLPGARRAKRAIPWMRFNQYLPPGGRTNATTNLRCLSEERADSAFIRPPGGRGMRGDFQGRAWRSPLATIVRPCGRDTMVGPRPYGAVLLEGQLVGSVNCLSYFDTKTTMNIEDSLFELLKRTAAKERTTMRRIIESALQEFLIHRGRPKCSFRLKDGSVPGHGLSSGIREGDWSRIRQLAHDRRGG